MAPANLPSLFNATSQDIEMLLAAQCHLGSKNLQVRNIYPRKNITTCCERQEWEEQENQQ